MENVSVEIEGYNSQNKHIIPSYVKTVSLLFQWTYGMDIREYFRHPSQVENLEILCCSAQESTGTFTLEGLSKLSKLALLCCKDGFQLPLNIVANSALVDITRIGRNVNMTWIRAFPKTTKKLTLFIWGFEQGMEAQFAPCLIFQEPSSVEDFSLYIQNIQGPFE